LRSSDLGEEANGNFEQNVILRPQESNDVITSELEFFSFAVGNEVEDQLNDGPDAKDEEQEEEAENGGNEGQKLSSLGAVGLLADTKDNSKRSDDSFDKEVNGDQDEDDEQYGQNAHKKVFAVHFR